MAINVDPQQMELTPQKVTWDGVDLGGTLGNVTIDFKMSKSDIKADQTGDAVLDRRISGFDIQVTTSLAQTRNLDRLADVFPSFVLEEGGGDTALVAKMDIGRSDRDNAKELVLHPLSAGDADVTQDWHFPLAYPSEESQLVFSPTEQTKAKLVWNCYPVLTGDNAPQWGYLGVMP